MYWVWLLKSWPVTVTIWDRLNYWFYGLSKWSHWSRRWYTLYYCLKTLLFQHVLAFQLSPTQSSLEHTLFYDTCIWKYPNCNSLLNWAAVTGWLQNCKEAHFGQEFSRNDTLMFTRHNARFITRFTNNNDCTINASRKTITFKHSSWCFK